MSLDASLPPKPLTETATQRPLWSALTRWRSAATPDADPVLGYESALPWPLGEDGPAETGEPRY